MDLCSVTHLLLVLGASDNSDTWSQLQSFRHSLFVIPLMLLDLKVLAVVLRSQKCKCTKVDELQFNAPRTVTTRLFCWQK